MIEFFLALFGGAYLAGKSISESIKSEAADARRKRCDEITNRMVNRDLECEMRDALNWKPKCGKNLWDVQEKRWKMLREIPEEDLVYVFGDNWEELFTKERVFLPYSSSPTDGVVDIWEMAFNLWLSGRHFIGQWHYRGYYYNNMPRGLPKDREQCKKTIFKMARVIERNIKKKYPDISLSKNPINENVFPDKKNTLIWNFYLDCLDIPKRIYPWGYLT